MNNAECVQTRFPALYRLASIVEQSRSVIFDRRTGQYSVKGPDGKTYKFGVKTARYVQALELALIPDAWENYLDSMRYVAGRI